MKVICYCSYRDSVMIAGQIISMIWKMNSLI